MTTWGLEQFLKGHGVVDPQQSAGIVESITELLIVQASAALAASDASWDRRIEKVLLEQEKLRDYVTKSDMYRQLSSAKEADYYQSNDRCDDEHSEDAARNSGLSPNEATISPIAEDAEDAEDAPDVYDMIISSMNSNLPRSTNSGIRHMEDRAIAAQEESIVPKPLHRLANKESLGRGDTSGTSIEDLEMRSFGRMTKTIRARFGSRAIEHNYFQICVSCMIVLNALQTAFEADAGDDAANQLWLIVTDVIFSCFFTVEIGLRLAVYRLQFFVGSTDDVCWNMFEGTLATVSTVSTVLTLMGVQLGNSGAFMAFRLLRFLKVARALRIFKAFRELRMLLEGLMASMRLLGWSVVFLVAINFVLGIFCTFAFRLPVGGGDKPDSFWEMVDENWGSTARSMFTLYQIQTGDSWASGIVRPIVGQYPHMVCCLFAYFVFVNIAVLNVIVAVIVEQVMKSTMLENDEEKAHAVQQQHDQLGIECGQFFDSIAQCGNTITRSDWASALKDDTVRILLAKLGFRPSLMDSLFDILDAGFTGEIEKSTFVQGLQSGWADVRVIDINSLQVDIWRLRTSFGSRIDRLGTDMGALRRGLPHGSMSHSPPSNVKAPRSTLLL